MNGPLWTSPWALGGIAVAAAAGVGTVLGVLSGRKKFQSEDFGGLDDREDGDAEFTPISDRGRDLIPSLAAQAGLPNDVARFLNFVARGESGWVPTVGRGDPSLVPDGVKINLDMSEAQGARTAYNRRSNIFAGCPHPPEDYQFGSGGLFAALPTYWLYHMRNTPLRCASPFEVFDPAFAIAGAYSFARGISQHPKFEGNVRSLRAGWGSLQRMIDRNYDHKLAKWRGHANDIGQSASYIDGPAPKFPRLDLLKLYHSLGGELALPGSAVA